MEFIAQALMVFQFAFFNEILAKLLNRILYIIWMMFKNIHCLNDILNIKDLNEIHHYYL